MKRGGAWRNRIVGHGEEPPDQLLANPGNWRVHPKPQQDALAGVLSEVGWVQDVIVNRVTGHVVDGHLRVSLAISRGEPAVPVVYVELSPEEERLVLASLDPLAAMAVTDAEKLNELLGEVKSGDRALNEMLASLSERSGADDGGEDRVPDRRWMVVAEFGEEREACGLFDRLLEEGLRCRVLTL